MFPCILAILLRRKCSANRFTQNMTPPVRCGLIALVGAGIALGMLIPVWHEPQRVLQSAALTEMISTTVYSQKTLVRLEMPVSVS
jgi:hypothetical protein